MTKNTKIIKTLEKLQHYNNACFPILSVYLNRFENCKKKNTIDYFHSVLDETFPIWQEDIFQDDILSIEGLLQRNNTLHKNLAVFIGGNKLFEVIYHDFAIPTQCHISHTPILAPLTQELQKQNRYLVVLADREKAIYFTFKNGEVEAYEEFKDAIVPQKVKANKGEYYARNDIILRHIENHLHRHLKRISHHVDDFIKDKNIQAVLIGGHKTLFNKIEKHLPHSLQAKIIGEFITELNIPKNDIIRHSQKVLSELYKKDMLNISV